MQSNPCNKEVIEEEVKQLQLHLVGLRGRVAQIASNPKQNQEETVNIRNDLISLTSKVHLYIQKTPESVSPLQTTTNTQPVSMTGVSSMAENIPINLYLWQLFNFICINSECFPAQLAQLVVPLIEIETRYERIHSANSLKNSLIFVHNWLAQMLKKGQEHEYWERGIRAFWLLLGNYYEKEKQKQQQKADFLGVIKTEQHRVAQLQWLSLIFMKLFDRERNIKRTSSQLKQIVQASQDPKALHCLLHMLGNYLQNMIDTRVTTELVAGYECKIKDIKDLYRSQSKNVSLITLSTHDLEFIVQILSRSTHEYKRIVREHLINRLQRKVDQEGFMSKWTENAEMTTEIGHILNCVLFIGGYNKDLQDFIIKILLERDTAVLEYLQLSYLLYRNIESTRYKSKVHLLTQMEMQAKSKLFRAVQIETSIESIDTKDLSLEKMLAPGQMVFLLRLLTNLVHINHRAQVPFEKEPKYLHMIMSLTHDSISQVTMKEWAIMFIRNVTEWSEKLREEISKIQLEMKVE